MARNWFWGDLPNGFKKFHVDQTRMIVMREGTEAYLKPESLLANGSAETEESCFQGRERLTLLRLDNGDSALVRAYRHGGVLRHLTGGFFFTWPPRPFKELAVTEEARRRGLPTVEIMAACVERICGPFYRGWLVMRQLEGARDLWAVVQDDYLPTDAKASLLEAVARTIRLMHRRGIYHGDLNLRNILVRFESQRPKSYIIDFDKARFFPGEVPAAKARRNLVRLRRSIRKLDPQGRHLSRADWEILVRLYREAAAG